MATNVVSIGVPLSMVQNTVYALPGRGVSVVGSAQLDFSNDIAFGSQATAAANVVARPTAVYVRCTAVTNCIMMAKLD